MEKLVLIAKQLGDLLQERKLSLVTAESCTGGQVASALTSNPKSSGWFERGFVTYSNESKTDLLHVSTDIIKTHGAVSEETAKAMAEGAIKNSNADVSISITGIAGPDGGSKEKPVGTVWIAWAFKNKATITEHFLFAGDRLAIRTSASTMAMTRLIADLIHRDPA